MRFSGLRSWLSKFVSILEKRLGKPEAARGRFMLSESLRWAGGGASIHYDAREAGGDEGADHVVIEICGAVLQEWGPVRSIRIMREIMALGSRVTRLDVAVDLEGDGVTLVSDVERACDAGELCRARVHRVVRGWKGGAVQGETVYVGSRGKGGSGRFLRVYDKGLETESAPRGRWVRWEAEFTDQCAREAALKIIEAGEEWGACLLGLAFGVCEFREVTGRREINRRPLSGWWASLVAGVGLLRPTSRKFRAGLEGWSRWLTASVLPRLRTFGERYGVPWHVVAESVTFGEVKESRSALSSLAFFQLEAAVFDGDIRLGGAA